MLDVLHYYFEQDTAFLSEDQLRDLTRTRTRLYEMLYERSYSWGASYAAKEPKPSWIGTPKTASDHDYDVSGLDPFDPVTEAGFTHKPFIPATEAGPDPEDPFNGILDAPLSH